MLIVRTLIKNANYEVDGFNMLDKWLKEVDRYADLIIMVDDNSIDGTYEKCKEFSDKVIIERTKFKDFYTEEQFMQNEIWELIRKNAQEGDWVIAVDSDEIMEDSFVSMKDYLMNNKGANCYSFQFIHLWEKDAFRMDKMWGNRWAYRMFRFYDVKFKVRLRNEIHLNGLPDYVKGFEYIPSSCGTIHYGYYPKERRISKSEKYLQYARGGDLVCAKSILDNKVSLVKLQDRLDIMKEMNLNPILETNNFLYKDIFENFKRRMNERAYDYNVD